MLKKIAKNKILVCLNTVSYLGSLEQNSAIDAGYINITGTQMLQIKPNYTRVHAALLLIQADRGELEYNKDTNALNQHDIYGSFG